MAFCVHCGKSIGEDDLFCASCGKPIEQDQPKLSTGHDGAPPTHSLPPISPIPDLGVKPTSELEPIPTPSIQPSIASFPTSQPTPNQAIHHPPQQKEGMSTGKKIGIAFTVLIILGAVVGAAYVLTRPIPDYDNGGGGNGYHPPPDRDRDTVPDSQDDFPDDPTQQKDRDGDGYGDNPSGNNPDEFPDDPKEWKDTDGDGVGDNSDAFKTDPSEWHDLDGDGTGDNSDYTLRQFEWSYQASGDWWENEYTWDIYISHAGYVAYRDYSIEERDAWDNMVTTSDPTIRNAVSGMKTFLNEKGWSDYDKIHFVLKFVQEEITYQYDALTTPYDDISQFPIETLYRTEGDCEDSSILFATFMKGLGYDVIFIGPPGHMAVGVADYGFTGISYVHESKKYFYAETTNTGWYVGELPSDYKDVNADLFKISGNQWVPKYSSKDSDISTTTSDSDGDGVEDDKDLAPNGNAYLCVKVNHFTYTGNVDADVGSYPDPYLFVQMDGKADGNIEYSQSSKYYQDLGDGDVSSEFYLCWDIYDGYAEEVKVEIQMWDNDVDDDDKMDYSPEASYYNYYHTWDHPYSSFSRAYNGADDSVADEKDCYISYELFIGVS